jgi:hypothetical protein
VPYEQSIEVTGFAKFSDEGVLEALRVVVPVTKTGRHLADAKSVLIEESGVRVAEYVPRHVLDVEGAEGGTERMARLAVRAHQGQIKILKDELRALGERYDTLARARLGTVDTPAHVPGAPYVQVPGTNIVWLEREDFPDPEPRQQADHSDMVPGFTKLLDYYEQLAHRDVVPSPPVTGDAAARRWKW